MEIRSGSVFFPRLRGGGPRTVTETLLFARDVERAVAGLSGYAVSFGGDDFQGTINFVVFADLVSATAPPPRTDLLITGMEISQVIQHFRSSQHLDGANVRPDNTIRLIARKPTGVRIYVDYDATAGLPPINQLTGQLEVRSSIGSLQSTLMPFSAIQPRRDDQIQRRDVTHTLNFLIPEDLCQGQLTISCRVFDVASPTKQSRLSERTLYFEEREPLRLFGVSVHYTGQSLDLAAPTQSDFINTVDFVEKVYPIPEAFMTGFTTIDFNEDMKADIKDGCGDGFNSLLDTLRDMRGDSTDVYYGLLPAGIDSGSVGGCGGGGVGAGFIGGGSTAAQEIGHAFGRDHAPCDSATRCGDPSDQDGEYPHYDGFPSDSIGEFGYDPA